MNHSLTLVQYVRIHAPASSVWAVLTDPEKIRQFLFGTEVISDWKIGNPIVFQGEYQGSTYTDKGLVTDLQINSLLAYDYWSGFSGLEDIPENYSHVRFHLKDDGDFTMLTLTQSGFSAENARDHSESAWKGILEKIRDLAE
jgi:uncharacterized protein YndB with AHSA1/START domain